VVEYNPEEEEEEKVVDIFLKTTMFQEAEVREPADDRKGSLMKSILKPFQNIFHADKNKNNLNKKIVMTGSEDMAEIYTEITRIEGKKSHARVVWKVKNVYTKHPLIPNLQLIPIMSSPTLRIHNDPESCQLLMNSTVEIKLRIKIPESYNENHLILVLKLKQNNQKFVGPTLMMFAKIIKRRSSQEEFSSFDVEEERMSESSLEKELRLLKAGNDVYNEEQLFSMASILMDEGMGSFDRCMMTLRALRGDIQKARSILSEIMFKAD
jgi:hypothetical protein